MKFTRTVFAAAAVAVAAVHAAPSPLLSVDAGANVGVAAGVGTGPVAVGVDANVGVGAHVGVSALEAAAQKAGINLSKAPITFEQYQTAVTAAGLPVPDVSQFLGFLGPLLGPTGEFTGNAADVASDLLQSIFKAIGQIDPSSILNIVKLVTGLVGGLL